MSHSIPRRQMLIGTAAALSAAALPAARAPAADAPAANPNLPDLSNVKTRPAAAQDPWKGLLVGVATYSLRKLPLDAAIKAIQRVGLASCTIKDFHLSLKSTTDQRNAVLAKFKEAGITPYSCGTITMKADEADLRNTFEYARDIGAKAIVCSPAPDALPLCEKFVKEFDIKMAIHNHGPEDKRWPGPYDIFKAIEKLDPRVGLCIDVGHTARAGTDPAEAIEKCAPRLYDLHMKDLARLDRRNAEIECGRGVLDIKAMLAALLKIKYAGQMAFEYELHPEDPAAGLAECVGYVKGLLA